MGTIKEASAPMSGMTRKSMTSASCIGTKGARLLFACLFFLLVAGAASAVPISGFVISEVMYEPSGGDNTRQWIELYNGTGSDIDLSLYHIEYGEGSLTDSITLSGTLVAGSTYVIGGPTSDANNGDPIYDQIFDFNPNLGDGGHVWREDGIALFETATSTMLHTIVYGGNNINVNFVDEQGATAVSFDDSTLNPGESIEFLGTTVWQVGTTPTPSAPSPALVPIPEPTPAILLALGLIGLGSVRKTTPAKTSTRA